MISRESTPKQRAKTEEGLKAREEIASSRMAKFQGEKDLFPYLRYVSNHWRRTSDAPHQKWHGLTLAIDDPVWQWFMPPNCRGCNCRVEQVSEGRMTRNGWIVSVERPTINDVEADYAVNWTEKHPDAARRKIELIDMTPRHTPT